MWAIGNVRSVRGGTRRRLRPFCLVAVGRRRRFPIVAFVVLAVVSLDPAPIGRPTARRAGWTIGLTRIGERRRAARGDRIRGDRDPNLTAARRAGADDHDEGGTRGDAENQSERQEGELARGHAPLSSSAGLLRPVKGRP
jgi:hypothetical protein